MKKDLKPTKLLVEATDGDPAWLGGVLRAIQVPVDSQGNYHSSDLRLAFERASAAASKASTSQSIPDEVFKTLITIADMGPNENTMRDWLRAEFKKRGLEVVGRGLNDAARFMLERKDGLHLYVLTHASANVRDQNGLISFSVYGLRYTDILWHAFICRPWGLVFLRKRDEIIKSMRKDRSTDKDTAFVSFSPGARKNLFELRVDELRSGPGWTNRI